jgi:uncharacterized coiled-coil DUF342 family protein
MPESNLIKAQRWLKWLWQRDKLTPAQDEELEALINDIDNELMAQSKGLMPMKGNLMPECKTLSDALRGCGADWLDPCSAMTVEGIAGGIILGLEARIAELEAEANQYHAWLVTLQPERNRYLDALVKIAPYADYSHDHEKSFQEALEHVTAIAAEALKG